MGRPIDKLSSQGALTIYNNWLGNNSADVRNAILRHGGWGAVFPGRLPIEIHRVRNYFNIEPQRLRRLTGSALAKAMSYVPMNRGGAIARTFRNHTNLNQPTDIKRANALTGEAYLDDRNRYWYLMVPISGVYHIWDGEAGFWAHAKAIVKPSSMPAKLVSPDAKTGGSHEVIMERPSGAALAAYLNERDFGPVIDNSRATRGSYNYGETVVSGTSAHTRLDVVPHKLDNRYINIRNAHAIPLRHRFFMPIIDATSFKPGPRRGAYRDAPAGPINQFDGPGPSEY